MPVVEYVWCALNLPDRWDKTVVIMRQSWSCLLPFLFLIMRQSWIK
jgi:hypothetical protein